MPNSARQIRTTEAPRGQHHLPISRESSTVWAIVLGCAFVAALVIYRLALHGQFVFDDVHLPFSDPAAGAKDYRFWLAGVRPVLMFTYWMNYLTSGVDPFGYHVVNIAIHAFNTLLVFQLVECLVKVEFGDRQARTKQERFALALACASIFLVHPLQTEAVAYVAGRSELLATTFLLAAWLTFLKGGDQTVSLRRASIVLVLWICAMLSKESAISLPAVLLLTDVWRRRSLRAGAQANWRLYCLLLFLSCVAAAFIVKTISHQAGTGFARGGPSPWLYPLSEFRALLIYVRLFLLPIGQNGDWAVTSFRSLLDRGAILYALVVILGVAAAAMLRRVDRLWHLGLWLFLLTLAPSSSLIRLPDIVAERRVYLPLLGLILMLASVIPRNWLARVEGAVITTALVLLLATISALRAGVWASRFTFWTDAVAKNSANARAHVGLGTALLETGNYNAALQELQAARDQGGETPLVLANLASAHEALKQWDRAVPELHKLVRIRATAANLTRLGLDLGKLGDASQALLTLNEALRADPAYGPAYAYRGIVEAPDHPAEAEEDFRHALLLDPGNEAARYGLEQLPKRVPN